MILVPTAYVTVAVVAEAVRHGPKDLFSLATDPSILLVTLVAGQAALVYAAHVAIRLRRVLPTPAYLALKPFPRGALVHALIAYAVFAVVVTILTWNREPNAVMVDLFQNGSPTWLVWFTVCVAAPVGEEVYFRGLVYPGLARSRLGPWGAAVITTFGWAILHLQYDVFDLLNVAALGLLLCWLRQRSGSLWLPMIVHAINNTLAGVLLTFFQH